MQDNVLGIDDVSFDTSLYYKYRLQKMLDEVSEGNLTSEKLVNYYESQYNKDVPASSGSYIDDEKIFYIPIPCKPSSNNPGSVSCDTKYGELIGNRAGRCISNDIKNTLYIPVNIDELVDSNGFITDLAVSIFDVTEEKNNEDSYYLDFCELFADGNFRKPDILSEDYYWNDKGLEDEFYSYYYWYNKNNIENFDSDNSIFFSSYILPNIYERLGVNFSYANGDDSLFCSYKGFDSDIIFPVDDSDFLLAVDQFCNNIANNQPSFEELGLNLSVRNDTTVDELKLNFSGNISDIEYIPIYEVDENNCLLKDKDGNLIIKDATYRLTFNNGQTFVFDQSQYSGFISNLEEKSLNGKSLEDLIYYSDANIAYEASQLFSSYFSGSNVDVRAVSDEECMVIINGVEYRYSIEQVSDLVNTYHDKDVTSLIASNIGSYINTNGRNFDVVLNPITNEYCLKYEDDEGYTSIDKSMINMELLRESDYVKTLMLNDSNFDINSLTFDELIKVMCGGMGFTNEYTAALPIVGDELSDKKIDKYMSKKIFKPVISVDDSNMYLNFASYLNDTDFSSIGNRISGIKNSYFAGLYFGSFVDKSTNILFEVDLLCKNLAKQINYSVSLLMNYDESLKADLDKIIDEFFEVSSVSYTGNDKINLFNDEVNEASNFFKSFSDDMYRKANEIALSLSGYITLTKEEYDQLMADGYDVGACSAQKITGNASDSTEESYYYISVENADKILSSSFNVASGDNTGVINGIYDLLNSQELIEDEYDELKNSVNINKYSSLTILSKNYKSYLEDYVNADVESKIKEQRSAYAFANLSPYYDDIMSDEYIQSLNTLRLDPNLSIFSPVVVNRLNSTVIIDYNYNDSLTLGMNALFYYYHRKMDQFEITFDSKRNDYYTKMCTLEKSFSNKACDSVLAYNYNQMKGYEKAVKYLEGIYDDGEIDPGDWLKYVAKCFGEGFVSTFTGFADLFNPEYDSSDYMKSFLAEMMVSTGFDEEDIQNKYKTGQISDAEYNLKRVVIDAYKSGDLKLESLANAGKISKITGEVTFEVLLTLATMGTASSIVTGLKLGGKAGTRLFSAAAMLKDLVQVGKGISKDKRNYINAKYGDLYDSVAEFERRNINKRANIAAYGAAAINMGLRSIGNTYAFSKGSSLSAADGRFSRVLNKMNMIDKNALNDFKFGALKGKLWSKVTTWTEVLDGSGRSIMVPASNWVKTSFLGRLGAGSQAIYNNILTTGGGRGASVASTSFYNLFGAITGDFENYLEKDYFNYGWENLFKGSLRAVTGINLK